MIFSDPFYQIHKGEIFFKSQCMQHEHALANFLHSLLIQQGYSFQTQDKRIWNKHHQNVVIVLADDFGICRKNFAAPVDCWFDSSTVIITDNHMPHQTQYRVCQLPESYFGIFDYCPANQNFSPHYRFNLCLNRMDHQRLVFFLEMLKQFPDSLNLDLVNFNAWDPLGSNQLQEDLANNFRQNFSQLDFDIQHRYNNLLDLSSCLPIRNHNFSIEQTHVLSFVNLVVETYAGNASIAFSEKIFRALVTPAPWTLFSAQNAVGYLRSLGFDVLDDLVDHSYDQVLQQWPYGLKKIQSYLTCSLNTYNKVKHMPVSVLQSRCLNAAKTNQNLLTEFKKQWPTDFANWLLNTIKFLQ